MILRAAEQAFAKTGDALPTVAEVAAGAGLAKGTVYLYFASQAEIYLALLLEGWSAVLARVAAAAGASPTDAGRIVTALAAALGERPDLLRLDSFGAVLEKQADPDALRVFKTALTARIAEAAQSIEQALDLPATGAERLLMNSYAFARGLWQAFGGADPSLLIDGQTRARMHPPFMPELKRALLAYWRGEANTDQRSES
ncbi:TetR family transcriptional regulator [Sphingomonas gellani]|uniref:TetR family transcriptional regulator n=1 Tax=Sphingomonas gellani TaxID=1166340 RepID=UPI00147C6BED|nr:TetR family transcriptional regulator [Sphingomonas gellani]